MSKPVHVEPFGPDPPGTDQSFCSCFRRPGPRPIRVKQEVTHDLAYGSPGTGAPNFKGLPPGRKESEKPHRVLANNGDEIVGENDPLETVFELNPPAEVRIASLDVKSVFSCVIVVSGSSDFHSVLQGTNVS